MSCVSYASSIGSLIYAIVCTQPDISHVVCVISRYIGHPGKMHWQAVKWILQYLRGTADVGLVYDRSSNTGDNVTRYVNFDYAEDIEKRISLTRYLLTLADSAISWKASL